MDIRITDRGYWDDLIIDRLSGNLSADDRARLERWLDESEEHRQYYSQMKELWDSSEVANPAFSFLMMRKPTYFSAKGVPLLPGSRVNG